MTAINVFVIDGRTHLFTDGATRRRGGPITDIGSKTYVAPHMPCAIAACGWAGLSDYLGERIVSRYGSFDEMMLGIEGDLPSAFADLEERFAAVGADPQYARQAEIVVIGWSAMMDQAIAFHIPGHALGALPALKINDIESGFAMPPLTDRPAIDREGDIDCQAVALMQRQRSEYGAHRVGGLIETTTICRAGTIRQRILHRWPEDVPEKGRVFEAAHPFISPAEYKGLLATLNPKDEDARDDPEAIIDLTGKVDVSDPDEFIRDASAYVRDGKLKTSTFRTLIGQNRAARRDDAPASPYKAGREFVKTTLEPGLFQDRAVNAIARTAQARALSEFDAWAEGNPQAQRGAAMSEAQNITERYQLLPFNEMKMALGKSRYFADKGIEQITVEDVTAAEDEVLKDLDSGQLSRTLAALELRRLSDWRKALELEMRRREQSNRNRNRR